MSKRLYLPLLLALGGCQADGPVPLNGYVEAEPLRIAAAVSGRITQLAVDKGAQVQAGQALFSLDQDKEQAAVNEAAARLQQSQAQAADLDTGKRPAEIDALQANLVAAQASLTQAQTEFARQQTLAHQGYTPAANLDTYQAQRDTAAANVKAVEAQIRTAKLAGRDQTRHAATAGSQASAAALAQAQWALAQKTVTAPAAARVENRYYQTGEWVAAGSPVLSLLSPDQLKVRFFVPETTLGTLKVGDPVTLECDGCPAPLAAHIHFIASSAEFTPPVLYTKEHRATLVYLVEARPADTSRLHAGQPIDVWLGAKPATASP